MKTRLQKTIYLNVALLLLSPASFSQEEREIIAANKIKSCITYISDTENDKGKKRSRVLYDKNGNDTEFNFYDKNEQLEKSKEVYEYNSSNDKIRTKSLDSLGKTEYEYSYTYKDGRLKEEKEVYMQEKLLSFITSTRYYYNEKGLLMREKYKKRNYLISKKGKKESSEVMYAYDSKGNRVLKININYDGSIYNKWISVYDQNNNRISLTVYYPICRSKDTSQSQFKGKDKWLTAFDKNNREIEEWSYDSEGRLEYHSTTKYDEAGYKIESCSYGPTGTLSSKTIRTVDTKGKELKVEAYNINRGTYYAYFDYEYYP